MKGEAEGTNLLKMRNFKGIQLINASWGSLEEQINSNPEGNSKLKNDYAAKKSLGVNVKLCLRDKWKQTNQSKFESFKKSLPKKTLFFLTRC